MAISGHLTVRALTPVAAGLRVRGHDPVALLARAGIAPGLLDDVEGRVPHAAAMRLWEEAAQATGDPCLGLHLAESAPWDSFEVHAYAIASSATLGDALRRACRYQRLIHDSTALRLEAAGPEAVLRHTLPGGAAVPRQPAEFLAAVWVRCARRLLGDDWAPVRLLFAHPTPASVVEQRRYFRAPLVFSAGTTAMVFPAGDLARPNPRSDAGLAELLDRYAAAELARHGGAGTDTVGARLRAFLEARLADGEPTAAEAARAQRLSVRSLHRALAREDESFRALHDQLRQQRAIALLVEGRSSIAETAFLVGFSELSSFYRAFRRWTGRTPAEFRRRP